MNNPKAKGGGDNAIHQDLSRACTVSNVSDSLPPINDVKIKSGEQLS